jgi:hypothetical protein
LHEYFKRHSLAAQSQNDVTDPGSIQAPPISYQVAHECHLNIEIFQSRFRD